MYEHAENTEYSQVVYDSLFNFATILSIAFEYKWYATLSNHLEHTKLLVRDFYGEVKLPFITLF